MSTNRVRDDQIRLTNLEEGRLTNVGGSISAIKDNLAAGSAPTANDDSGDGYAIGSLWIYGDIAYVATSVSAGAATWRQVYPAIVPSLGSDDVANESTVSGSTVSDALETLDSNIVETAFDSISVSGSINGSNTVFTLGEAVTDRALVLINGLVQDETDDYTISGTTLTFTSAPSSGDDIEVKKLAGSVGGSIADITPQFFRAIGLVDVMQMRPLPGTINFSSTGMSAFTGQGGGYTARTPAYGTGKTAMNRVSFSLSSTSVAGWYTSASTTVWTGGKFTVIIHFAITESSFTTGARGFIGLTEATGAATNVDPATLTQCIGIGQIDGDSTQFYAIWGDGSSNTEALGISFDEDSAYELEISSADVSAAFSLTLRNRSTGDYTTINKTNGPVNTTSLITRLWRCANGTGLTSGWDSGNLMIVREFV